MRWDPKNADSRAVERLAADLTAQPSLRLKDTLVATTLARLLVMRGISEADYMGGNLLQREVTAEDVAEAFLFLALARKTTAATLTVDGGNIEASLR